MSLKKTPTGSTSWPDYRTIWRWHFYAGLFCMPCIVLLAISGAIYLFKPQIDAWIDRSYDHLHIIGHPTGAQAQVRAGLRAIPGSMPFAYELPNSPDRANRVIVTRQGKRLRVYVHPETLKILKTIPEEEWSIPGSSIFSFPSMRLFGIKVFVAFVVIWCTMPRLIAHKWQKKSSSGKDPTIRNFEKRGSSFFTGHRSAYRRGDTDERLQAIDRFRYPFDRAGRLRSWSSRGGTTFFYDSPRVQTHHRP